MLDVGSGAQSGAQDFDRLIGIYAFHDIETCFGEAVHRKRSHERLVLDNQAKAPPRALLSGASLSYAEWGGNPRSAIPDTMASPAHKLRPRSVCVRNGGEHLQAWL